MRPRKPGKRTAKGSAPYFPTIFASLRDNRQSTEPALSRGTTIPPDTLPQTPLCTTAPSRGTAGQTAQCSAQAIAARCTGHRSALHRPTHRAAFPRAAQRPSRSAPQRHTAHLSPRPLLPPRPTGAAPARAGSKGTEKSRGMPCVMQLGIPRDGSHIIEKVKVSYSPPCINGTARPRMPLRLPRPRPLPPPCLPG